MALLKLLLGVACWAAAATAQAGQVAEGDALPTLVLADHQGAQVELRADSAPVVIVEFWASWCAPCRKILPAVVALAGAYPDRMRLYAINVDRDPAKAADFLAEHLRAVPAAVTLLFDPESIALARFGAPGMPALYVVENGIVRLVVGGARADIEERLRKFVEGEG